MTVIQNKWSKGNEVNDNGQIGQLVINGNSITFHIDGYGDPFARNFVCTNDSHYYKVYTVGQGKGDSSGCFYRVTKAFMYKGQDYKNFVGDNIEGISSFSFEVPELADWLKIQSVEFSIENDKFIVHQNKITPILLKEKNPRVYMAYEVNLPFLSRNANVEMTLRSTPRVFVEYETFVDDSIVRDDLGIIMRFFSLLIGRISFAEDIRLTIGQQSLKMWLYFNRDFSYNMNSTAYYIRHRIAFEKIAKDLASIFEKWFLFSKDEKYSFLQNSFFHYNGMNNSSVEEVFLTYCKFLEGYDLRKTEDEKNANILNDSLYSLLKNPDIKSALSPVFIEAGSTYKPKEIAKWISAGFLERVSLKERIKRIDKKYLEIIGANSINVIKDEDSNDFYLRITRTRNYYSHFKQDTTGILSYAEMYYSLELLESLIITILLNEMGMPIEDIKTLMVRDEKYWHLLTHQKQD